jgi:O-6-methylguanine DNA methyltransferase
VIILYENTRRSLGIRVILSDERNGYGQVAAMAGNPKMARAVGNALHKNPDPDSIPCYRVVNAKGELASEFVFGGARVQAKLLKADGIVVENGKVDLKIYGMDD